MYLLSDLRNHRWVKDKEDDTSCDRWTIRSKVLQSNYVHVRMPDQQHKTRCVRSGSGLNNLLHMMGGLNALLMHRLSESDLRLAPFTQETVQRVVTDHVTSPSLLYSPGGVDAGSILSHVNSTYDRPRVSERRLHALEEQHAKRVYVDCVQKFKRKLSLMIADKSYKLPHIVTSIDNYIHDDFGLIHDTEGISSEFNPEEQVR